MRRPALTAAELKRLPADYREAARLCRRWEGARVGDGTRCRSALVGRTITVRLRVREKPIKVTVVGCAIPRSDRKSKRCKTDYLVRPLPGQGYLPGEVVVDGGRIRNASRTPRPTHDPAMRPEHDDPRKFRFYELVQRDNADAGLPRTTGLDLPYRHRVGSSVCCPDSHENPVRLADEVRWAMEGEGMSTALRERIMRLGRHLRDKHGAAVRLPAKLGRNHERTALRIIAAGDAWCGRMLDQWEAHAREDAAERRARPKKRRPSAMRARKAKTKRAVKRATHHTRAGLMRDLTRKAA